jgi:membrane protease YdiL (CAAX protease family)
MMLALALVVCRPLFTRWTGYCWDLALLAVCLPILQQDGLWSRMVFHGAWLPAYLVVSVLIFLMSVLLTAAQPRQYLRRVALAWRTESVSRQLSWSMLATATAVYEELIWRVVVQSLLLLVLPPFAAVVLTSMLFTLWHRHRTGNSVWLVAELFVFSMVAGSIMIAMNDPLAAVIAHLVRNYLVYMASSTDGRT